MAVRPVCLFCFKAIPKWTRTVFVERLDSGSTPAASDEFVRRLKLAEPLLTKADCQKHTNDQVVSVSYWPSTSSRGRVVSAFGTWDGESYAAVAGYFCSGKCAQAFGRAAARAGWRLQTEKQEPLE